MTCERCNGLGYIEAPDQSVDACKSCAARAEAQWRTAHPLRTAPLLRVVASKGRAA